MGTFRQDKALSCRVDRIRFLVWSYVSFSTRNNFRSMMFILHAQLRRCQYPSDEWGSTDSLSDQSKPKDCSTAQIYINIITWQQNRVSLQQSVLEGLVFGSGNGVGTWFKRGIFCWAKIGIIEIQNGFDNNKEASIQIHYQIWKMEEGRSIGKRIKNWDLKSNNKDCHSNNKNWTNSTKKNIMLLFKKSNKNSHYWRHKFDKKNYFISRNKWQFPLFLSSCWISILIWHYFYFNFCIGDNSNFLFYNYYYPKLILQLEFSNVATQIYFG